jgi:hypothetical protein
METTSTECKKMSKYYAKIAQAAKGTNIIKRWKLSINAINANTERVNKGYIAFARLLGLNTHNYDELADLLTPGNLKLPKTTAIFNCSSATDCISMKMGLCAACKAGVKCYALKAETTKRPFVLPFRRRQQAYWERISAEAFSLHFLTLNAFKVIPFTKLRINESGDFYDQKALNKAERIANLLGKFKIKVYCYTSRSDLSFEGCKNLIVYGSGFIKPGIAGIFQIIKNKKDKPKQWSICGGNCRICNWCQIRGKRICILAH